MQLCSFYQRQCVSNLFTLASRIFDFIRKVHRRAHRKSRKPVVSMSSRDLHSWLQKLADNQAKVIELEQRIDALQTTAATATAATDHRVDTLQSSTENATQAAVSELQRTEHELSQCYALLNEVARTSR